MTKSPSFMTYFYLVPTEFLEFSIAMEILFAIITMSVAFFSFRIYRISRQRETKLFGISFALISISYVVWAIVHSAIVFPSIVRIAQLFTQNISRLGGIGLLMQVMLFISGLGTLSYTNLKIKSGKAYYLIVGLAIIAIIAPLVVTLMIFEPVESSALYGLLITSRILSVFFLTFLIYSYFKEYSRNGNGKTLLIGLAFSLLLISSVNFIFSLTYYEAYIIGHILELIAYLFILISLILSIRK